MVIRCKGCSGALRWSPKLQKMKCAHCENLYDAGELSSPETEKDTMECNIFVCTSCGAKLAVNDAEAATFCAYCGNPTIVFDRVSKVLKPVKIIPFKVECEEAESIIRERFKKGKFVPRNIKNFEIERMSGIYVPYRVYDIEYHDNQVVRVSRKNFRKDFHCTATTQFKGIAEDVSLNFCNESSRRLELFDLTEAKDFHEDYLSGFYADRYDEKTAVAEKRVIERCREMFDAEVLETIEESGGKQLLKNNPKVKIVKQEYTLLPVWFLTLRYKNNPYTMLVNGQTGKVIGSVPFVWWKALLMFLMLSAIFLMLLPKFYVWLFNRSLEGEDDFITVLIRYVIWALPTLISYCLGWMDLKRLRQNRKRTSAQEMVEFAGDRQEDAG